MVKLRATIRWGAEWNGSYYKETPGIGQRVTVICDEIPIPFLGCPVGEGHSIVAAIADFFLRSRAEYAGNKSTYEVTDLKVTEIDDYRGE